MPKIETSAQTLSELDCDVVALLAFRGEDGVQIPDGFPVPLADLEAVGFEGKRDEFVRLPAPGGWRARGVALVGAGRDSLDADTARYAAGTASRRLAGCGSVAIAFGPDVEVDDDVIAAVAEGALLGAYDYFSYRNTSLKDRKTPVERIIVRVPDPAQAVDAVATAAVRAEAVAVVRDLVNESPLDLYPAAMAERVRELVADLPIDVEVWDETRLADDGFGGILGVGRGSARPPRLVRLSYAPDGAGTHLALVGKGITFDTGGLSLKPAASMIGMKYDMAGAATVFGVVRAVAQLAVPTRITAWLCLAENMPSGDAIRPGDVLTIRGGTTVEVLNTDAEGRLVLADGLVAASEENPDAIVDVATLTGAAIVALGTRYIGTFGDEDLVGRVLEAATAVDESLWRMPLPAELRPLLNSDIADIANVKPGNTAGGMLIAAHFLREFVGKNADGRTIPWAHLDIAGAAQNRDAGYGFTPKGPTGATVRTLLELAIRMSAG